MLLIVLRAAHRQSRWLDLVWPFDWNIVLHASYAVGEDRVHICIYWELARCFHGFRALILVRTSWTWQQMLQLLYAPPKTNHQDSKQTAIAPDECLHGMASAQIHATRCLSCNVAALLPAKMLSKHAFGDLRRPHDRQSIYSPWFPPNFNAEHSYKVLIGPVTGVSAQHVQILYF